MIKFNTFDLLFDTIYYSNNNTIMTKIDKPKKTNRGGKRIGAGRPATGRQNLAQIQITKNLKSLLDKQRKNQTWEEFLQDYLASFFTQFDI